MTTLGLRVALVLVGLGVLLLVYALAGRRRRGLGSGEEGDVVVPEEWKSSKRVTDGHRLQLGTYFILIEEEYAVRPPHGVVVLGDGLRVVVENTDELRSKVLAIAEEIRERRLAMRDVIRVRQPAAKCRACGRRRACNVRE